MKIIYSIYYNVILLVREMAQWLKHMMVPRLKSDSSQTTHNSQESDALLWPRGHLYSHAHTQVTPHTLKHN